MAARWRFVIEFIGEIDREFYEKSTEHNPKLLGLVLFEQIAFLWQAILIKLTQRWKFF